MPWIKEVPAVLESFFPGQVMEQAYAALIFQEDGNALAAVLFGDVNPSAKLPVTFPISDSQNPLQTEEQYPGVDMVETYSEGLFVGFYSYSDKLLM